MSEEPDERAESGRPGAVEIYQRVRDDADDELSRPPLALAFSGLFAGFSIGATALAVAAATALLGGDSSAKLVGELLYPVGYVAVILGRGQLFSENTLYPVVASLEDRGRVPGTLRLWGIVLATNVIGALIFALLVVRGGALPGDLVGQLEAAGHEAANASFGANFIGGLLAGWLLALVAWLMEATETGIARFASIWALTTVVGLAALDHPVSTAVQVFGAAIGGQLSAGTTVSWFFAATLGSIVGGVFTVTLLNYGQVRGGQPTG